MYRITFILSIFIGTLNLQGQDEAAKEVLTKWENASQYTIDLIEAMPEEHFDFQPTPETRTFTEQVSHMVDNMTWLSTDYLGAEKFDAKEPTTKAEYLEYMRLACAYAGKSIAVALQDSTLLDTKMDFFAGPMSGRQIIRLMNNHVTHHRGQLIVYLRLKGIKPPRYVGW